MVGIRMGAEAVPGIEHAIVTGVQVVLRNGKSVLEILFYKKTENLPMKSINIFKNTLELLTIS